MNDEKIKHVLFDLHDMNDENDVNSARTKGDFVDPTCHE